jgi:acetyl esterase/lipase
VSVGYAITVGLWGAVAVLTLLPVRRPRRLAEVNYLLTMAINEAPQLAICLLLYPTVLAVWQDGLLTTPAGWGAAGAAAAVLICLLLVGRRAYRAEGVVEAALTDGLATTQGFRRGGARRLRLLLTPYPARPRVVQRVKDIAYGPAGRFNRLDLYRHRSRPAKAPTLVYFHGGSYVSGSKHWEARALLHRLAADGWVCVSANYRLRPAADFRDHLVDVKKVLAWVRREGPAFGVDPEMIAVAGSSAGGHLAALAALTPNEPAFQPGFEDVATHVTAAVCLYGYYGRYYGHTGRERPPSSPLDYDAATAPPFFVAHGDHDTYVPVQGARALVAHLRRGSKQPVVYAELPGAQHGFDVLRSVRFESVIDGVEAFLSWVRCGRPAPAPQEHRGRSVEQA